MEIDVSESAGVRYLHFGSEWIQGAMRIRRPVDLELVYTREMMAGLLLRDDPAWPRSVLAVGLGAGSLAKFCYWRLPQCRVEVVEIDPGVLACARQFFKLPPPDERFEVHIADAAHFVEAHPRQWDLILVDGFDHNARAGKLEGEAFYRAVHTRLTHGGLAAVNLFGRSRRHDESFARLHRAFGNRAFAFPSCDSGNVIAFGAKGPAVDVTLAELRTRADTLKETTGLDLRPTVSRLEAAHTAQGGRLRI